MKLTKAISLVLCLIMAVSAIACVPFTASAQAKTQLFSTSGLENTNALYALAAGADDENASNAAIKWFNKNGAYYFYLTSNIKNGRVKIYNGFSQSVTFDSITIPANDVKVISFDTGKVSNAKAGNNSYSIKFRLSTAESSIFVNGTGADNSDLFDYLSASKSNYASATGAILDEDGTVDYTAIKKIKGRGNTTWSGTDKKSFNITYTSAVSIGKMDSGKKYSLLANFQDASLSRNRFLYDLSDAVGMPYASDSRYVDFYVNGKYIGSYQAAQKVEVGKKDLVNDINDKAYLNADGTLAENFPFLMEIDAGANWDDDFCTYTNSGNKITIKSPELEKTDPLHDAVLNNIKNKYDEMSKAVKRKNDNMSDYIDIDSFAKMFLINELGKNWDVGISSLFLVYKQDSNGNYKFFASPVWDYDNSLGNARGVSDDLNKMGVSDYTKYTGWWVKYKLDMNGNRPSSSNYCNLMGMLASNSNFLKIAAKIWFEDFVPAINTFSSSNVSSGEIYSYDVYYNKLVGSANMNYSRGWEIVTNSSWICDHSSLKKATYDYNTKQYSVASSYTKYDSNFAGEFSYAVDWMLSRSAWISNEFDDLYDYTPTPPTEKRLLGDVNGDGKINIIDATLVQKYSLRISIGKIDLELADVNSDEKINIIDATLIQKYSLKISVKYPIGEAVD